VLAEALENGRADLALRLGGAMWQFWYMRGHWSEGGRWLDSALAAAGAKSDPQTRIDALDGAGILALWQGNLERAGAVADQRLALAAEPDSGTFLFAGLVADGHGNQDRAEQLYEESARLARDQGDSVLLAMAVNNLGTVAVSRGDYERALVLFEESLAIGREQRDQDRLARASMNLVMTTLKLGDARRARELLRDSLVAAREIGLTEGFIGGFVGLGAAYAREDPARAARLIGRADLLCEEAGLPRQLEDPDRTQTEAELRAQLGENAYAAAYAEGRALQLEDALALALSPD